MRRWLVAAAGLGMVAGAGFGQVLLPPPEKPEGFNKIPPPPDPNTVRLKQAVQEANDQRMADQERLMAEREAEKRRDQQLVNNQYTQEQLLGQLADVQYESMVWRDETGKMVELDQPPMIAAFNHNPLLDGPTLDAVWAVLEDRRERQEQRLIDNPEIVRLVAAGEIEKTSLADLNGLQRMRMLMVKLNLEKPILQELGERGVIDRKQAFMNQIIVKEYATALRAQIAAGAEGMEMQALVAPMLRGQADEAIFVYESMLLAAAPSLTNIAQRLDLSEAQQAILDYARSRLAIASDRSTKLEAMNSFVSTLDPDQIRAFLEIAAG